MYDMLVALSLTLIVAQDKITAPDLQLESGSHAVALEQENFEFPSRPSIPKSELKNRSSEFTVKTDASNDRLNAMISVVQSANLGVETEIYVGVEHLETVPAETLALLAIANLERSQMIERETSCHFDFRSPIQVTIELELKPSTTAQTIDVVATVSLFQGHHSATSGFPEVWRLGQDKLELLAHASNWRVVW